MNHQSNPPSSLDSGSINERVLSSVRSHRTTLRVLTSIAVLLGFLSIAGSGLTVFGYFVFYRPKQVHMMNDAGLAHQRLRTNALGTDPNEDAANQRKFLGATMALTYALSIGTAVIAFAVGTLALGTMVLLAIIILQRRATLHQVSASLAQISAQLRELADARTVRPPPSG